MTKVKTLELSLAEMEVLQNALIYYRRHLEYEENNCSSQGQRAFFNAKRWIANEIWSRCT